jgi:hypothetical protein
MPRRKDENETAFDTLQQIPQPKETAFLKSQSRSRRRWPSGVLGVKYSLATHLELDHPAGNFKGMTAPITRSVGKFCYFFLWLKFLASVFAF